MPLTAIAGGALFAERHGSGPPRVLALHGWGRRGSDFARALDGLDAVALDLPGFGASPEPAEAMGAAGYAEAIEPVFELFDAPPVIVGHSFGGRVAVAHEAARPGSAGGLVLAGVPLVRREGAPSRPSWRYRMVRAAHRARVVSDERMERIRRSRGSADYRAATGVMRDVLVRVVNESYETELAALGIPVHMIWGTDDFDVPVAVARRAAEIVSDAGVAVEVEVVEGAGHHLPLTDPDRLRRAIVAMDERVGPR